MRIPVLLHVTVRNYTNANVHWVSLMATVIQNYAHLRNRIKLLNPKVHGGGVLAGMLILGEASPCGLLQTGGRLVLC